MASDPAVERLQARGTALWRSLSDVRPFNAAESVVVLELCRMADRLDTLDALLSGDVDVWARLEKRYDRGGDIELKLDEALAESRQLAATFQRLAASLNLPEAKAETKDGIDDLSRRREARLTS